MESLRWGLRRHLGVSRPALVVVPLSTLPNWAAELATWAPHLHTVALHGPEAARRVLKAYDLYCPATDGDARSRASAQVRWSLASTSWGPLLS